MTSKKKKQASGQQTQKSGSGSTAQPKTPGRFKMKSKQKDESAKDSSPSLVPFTKHGIGYASLVLIIAASFGIFQSYHVSRMFENERFFSHLSALERELSFRTEMGLYYSYYKTIVEAPTFLDGVHSVMNCNVTEYPDTINTLKRLNLYPEAGPVQLKAGLNGELYKQLQGQTTTQRAMVVLGFAFRMYDSFTTSFNIHTKTCYTVNRGYNQPPVQSCEGMGELSFFYVYAIFYLSGLMISMFFLLCFFLSGSILGGLIGTLSYLYNHGECTRVMWTPPLRESFSYPFLVFQLLAVTLTIKSPKVDWRHMSLVAITTSLFMVPWQFAQFALLTQIIANLEPFIYQLPNQIVIWAHITSILRSKFSSFRNFDTALYTCAPEFDFLDPEILKNEWDIMMATKDKKENPKMSDPESDEEETEDLKKRVNLKPHAEATQGEYNNPEQEALVEWINTKTPRTAVFAGAMPTMATVKLCTGRAIVNHPHYEDVGIRERTHKVYQIFSRKPPAVVWQTLNSMKVTHVVVDVQWCRGRPKAGCGMVDIWDLEDEENRSRPSCCSVLMDNPAPFKKAFSNDKYYVFQLHHR
ncbi:putative C-mannosyltransferase DPY19L1 [Stylophora pistillata]|uniref:Putative C-mannosyltransferase DPY19L1 n=1 Tax=Stylophora pistillata TaxID=50429 RepID=A0A2B4SEC4_STYPI|nr:putative C-mannosyltransferase DPY19L1 [Stylophora pistillata]